MKAQYPERPLIIAIAAACILTLLGAMAITISPVLQLLLLGIQLCISGSLIWYLRETK